MVFIIYECMHMKNLLLPAIISISLISPNAHGFWLPEKIQQNPVIAYALGGGILVGGSIMWTINLFKKPVRIALTDEDVANHSKYKEIVNEKTLLEKTAKERFAFLLMYP